MSAKITEVTDMETSNAASAKAAPAAEQPVDPKTYIGQPCISRFQRTIVCSGPPLVAAIEIFEEKKAAGTAHEALEALYLVPLLIEQDGCTQEIAGQKSLRGYAVWNSYGFVWHSDIPKYFPTLSRLTNWRKLFINLFEATPGLNKEIGKEVGKPEGTPTYPIFQANGGGDPSLVYALAEMCNRDRLIAFAGPVSF